MLENYDIKNMIYEIRGKQVMLDRDLAKLYQVETRLLNQKVKRNINRFPSDFCFQMTNDEFNYWKSHIVISNADKIGLRRSPYVFTEQGVAMLSAIINSEVAAIMSVNIMDAFVEMQKIIHDNKNLLNRIVTAEYKLLEHDLKLNEIFQMLENKKMPEQKIFFEGEIYDAYSLIIEFISKAKDKIIIIDNYIDKSILDMLIYKNKNTDVIIVTKQNKLTNLDINKFNQEYPFLKVIINNQFYDCFIIIDETLYHIGASFAYLGKKCFGINNIKDKEVLKKIILNIDERKNNEYNIINT